MTTNVNIMSPLSHCKRGWSRWLRRILVGTSVAIVATIGVTILSVLLTEAQVGLGGMISEKMLGRTGISDSSLLLSRTGTNTTLSVIGFAPVVSTLPATAIGEVGGVTTATLQATVTSMKGLPSATGYFQWGYAVGALTNTTATIPITAIGNYSKIITGFTSTDITVYYRFVTDADGTAYGTVLSFGSPPAELGNILLKNLLRICAAAAVIINAIKQSHRGISVLMSTILIGMLAFVIVSMIIELVL